MNPYEMAAYNGLLNAGNLRGMAGDYDKAVQDTHEAMKMAHAYLAGRTPEGIAQYRAILSNVHQTLTSRGFDANRVITEATGGKFMPHAQPMNTMTAEREYNPGAGYLHSTLPNGLGHQGWKQGHGPDTIYGMP
mgnify:FL=1